MLLLLEGHQHPDDGCRVEGTQRGGLRPHRRRLGTLREGQAHGQSGYTHSQGYKGKDTVNMSVCLFEAGGGPKEGGGH